MSLGVKIIQDVLTYETMTYEKLTWLVDISCTWYETVWKWMTKKKLFWKKKTILSMSSNRFWEIGLNESLLIPNYTWNQAKLVNNNIHEYQQKSHGSVSGDRNIFHSWSFAQLLEFQSTVSSMKATHASDSNRMFHIFICKLSQKRYEIIGSFQLSCCFRMFQDFINHESKESFRNHVKWV